MCVPLAEISAENVSASVLCFHLDPAGQSIAPIGGSKGGVALGACRGAGLGIHSGGSLIGLRPRPLLSFPPFVCQGSSDGLWAIAISPCHCCSVGALRGTLHQATSLCTCPLHSRKGACSCKYRRGHPHRPFSASWSVVFTHTHTQMPASKLPFLYCM